MNKTKASSSRFVEILREKHKNGTLKDILRDWKWILNFTKKRSGAVALYTLFGIFSSALALMSSVISKSLIDAIVSLDGTQLLPLVVVMVLAGAFTLVFQSLTTRFSAKLSIDMHNDVQGFVFYRLIHSDWMAITGYSTGDLLNRFSSDISTVSSCAVSWLPKVLIQSFTVLATLGVILYYDPVMALIGCASTPVLFFASRQVIRKQRDHNRKMRTVSSEMSAFQSETFRNIDTLKSFGVEDAICTSLNRHQNEYRSAALDYNLFSIQTHAWMTGIGTVIQYVALGYCLWRLWRGEILFGTMVLFLQQRSTLSNAFSSLVSLVPTALSGSISAERVRELTELKKEAEVRNRVQFQHCKVLIDGVQASYEPDQVILSDVCIKANPGEIIALVGASGEGKTTILRLLLGLLQPEKGRILLQDETGKEYSIGPETRHCFSYVPQGNTVLAGTVAQNLRLGNPNASDDEIIAALKGACAWEFVCKMPDGIHSRIGEGGKGLSEGQAQRISIARALLRKAPVMLLDEVTSALDSKTERKVLSHLTSLGITTIVTTHRPSVLSMCRRVYRVENKTVHRLGQEDIQKMTAASN